MKAVGPQELAQMALAGPATHTLLFGGSRSGKTYKIVRAIVHRAAKAARSRHAIMRFRFNHATQSIGCDTLPKVIENEFPGIPHRVDRQNWVWHMGNGSEIWLGGLDDKDRVEKVLGLEFASLFLNEISQIPWSSREVAVTRLAQKITWKATDGIERVLRPRMFYDCNPPSKGHWGYKLFVQHIHPETKAPLSPHDFAVARLNPADNLEHLPEGYIATLEGLGARMRRRFLEGEWADATPNALFRDDDIDKWRVVDGRLPDFVRVVVAVDPSGSGDEDNADNDEIGIVVAALGTDGNGYILEDLTVKAGPATWGRIATDAFDRHAADVVVGEKNYGGDMVRHTIQTARPRTNYKAVNATRGKAVRAEPISALYETGKVRHVGVLRELEDELAGFSTTGFTGSGSPNRADAAIWALTELFPALTKKADEPQPAVVRTMQPGSSDWMGV